MTKRLSALSLTLALAAGCHGAGGGLPSAGYPAAGASSGAAQGVAAALRSDRAIPAGIIGSQNTVTADMPVPRPDTKPCTVTLFKNVAFKNFNNVSYPYTPPTACKGPWAKVVLNVDISTSKGVQYDRTGIIWLDGAVIFFGTTAEPSPTLAPHWHVERDATDLSALFKHASTGQIELWNCYCLPNYNGIIYGTAYAQFYPPDAKYPAPRVPDQVIGIPYSPPLGGAATLPNGTATTMQIQTTLPRNVTSAYLDLYLQSQADEEQWFMCVPPAVWTQSDKGLGFCKNGPFREGEVRVDGLAAGIAPVYPWIYTGGLDPLLWAPIPGVQTLEFAPYRVDLTPFAAMLSNGMQQTVSVDVHNAYAHFTGAGDLLIYQDPKLASVTGKLVYDSLAPASQDAVSAVKFGSGKGLFGGPSASGPVTVTSAHNYRIFGYVTTSSGTVGTEVDVTSSFSSKQSFVSTPTEYVQLVSQDTKLTSTTTTTGKDKTVATRTLFYPLTVSYPFSATKSGYQLPLSVYQSYQTTSNVTGSKPSSSTLSNTVQSKDTMLFNSSGNWIGVKNGASSQLYTYKDSTGICYGRALTSTNNAIATDTSPGCGTKPPPQPSPKP